MRTLFLSILFLAVFRMGCAQPADEQGCVHADACVQAARKQARHDACARGDAEDQPVADAAEAEDPRGVDDEHREHH